MAQLGYALSSEEHGPRDLIRYAARAEEAGFAFALISDHFHPWIGKQGHSPFVWSVLGGLAQATERLEIGTGVTCPTVRMHPVIVAHAAATVASMMPGRFFLGLGSGENLNEHILGDRWPSASVRLEMLEEAIDVIRRLWTGEEITHQGEHYTVDRARLYTLPDDPPPVYVAASGEKAVALAARAGDGLIGVAPSVDTLRSFEKQGGEGKPTIGQVHVCWAASEQEARRIAHAWWPNTALTGDLFVELPTPRHFEQAAELVSEDDVAAKVPCGPDPERHVAAIQDYLDAGYERVYVHQIGPDQEGFLRFFRDEVLPRVDR